MKPILTFLLACCGLPAMAQITISAADMPLVNDTVRYSTSLTSITRAELEGMAGPNQTWNFNRLVPDFQEMASFKSPIMLAYIGFIASSYGTKDNDFSFDIPIPGGQGGATNVYNFYTKSSAGFTCDGRGFSFQGLPLPQNFTPKAGIYKFPMAYGNRDSSTYSSNTVNIMIASLRTSGKRVNRVDGWGTLTTPYGTFNCLRVRSEVKDTDYITVSGFPITIPLPRVSTEYKWLATGKKIPILEISMPSSGMNATIKYRDVYRPELFADLADFTANKTIFDPGVNDTCILNDNCARNPNSIQWTITPNTFVFTGGTNAGSSQAKIFFTESGTYTVTIKAQYNAGSDEMTRVNYITVTGNQGFDEQTIPSLTIFPNPVTSRFELWSDRSRIETIQLFDLTGKETPITVTDKTSFRGIVSTENVVPGMYVVRVTFANGQTAVQRINRL